MTERCPCCLRSFEKTQDYPLILVSKVERLPLPEFMDHFSAEAAQLQLQLSREERQDPNRFMSVGINRTPEIAAAYESEEVQHYQKRWRVISGLRSRLLQLPRFIFYKERKYDLSELKIG